MTPEIRHPWWSELRQNGMIISPAVLNEFLPEIISPIDYNRNIRLRDAFNAFASWSLQEHGTDKTGFYRWIDAVLDDFLGYESRCWQKHAAVDDSFKVSSSRRGGPALRPARVLLNEGDVKQPRFLVSFDTSSKRIGLGRGRNEYSSFLELLRGTNVPLGILTNGWQFRLVFAGTDYDCWVEWDVERWFEDVTGKDQLSGFFTICGEYGTVPRDNDTFPLLTRIQESRTRQGELSQVLGEQTRRAVERLLKEVDRASRDSPELHKILAEDPGTHNQLSEEDQNNALYQATIRLMMRMVVSLFAEARGLLPTDNDVYYYSYGVEGLFAQLQNAKNTDGVQELEVQHQAWFRLLSLFRLIYEGSDLQDAAIPNYGGGLFRRGDPTSPDPVLRALAIYEDERVQISDAVVLEILSLLKIGKVKARVGRTTKMVSGAVDFSDLRTEYIGMMYEGLLDYQLRKVRPEEEAVVILNLGIQPALPFKLLEDMSEQNLKDLIQKLSKEKAEKKVESEDSGEESGEEQATETEAEEEAPSEESEEEPELDTVPESSDISGKIYAWAEKTVELAGLVKKAKGRSFNQFQYDKDVRKRARSIIGEIVGPNEMYLIRGSGTRKGTGTFYTKPQLAVPTVHRTLEPLVYDVEGEGEKRKLTPKTPEIILALKVCDPAMGSGSFLVAALRYLSDALYESLWYHKKIKPRGIDTTVITLPAGTVANGSAPEDLLRCPVEHERFEPMVKARLKRYIVERCIYGVDLNPLAVELGKLALWVETMDRDLPFEFLDHKLKVGNSLVGCWFDNFTEYPVMAWMREGGDKGHKGVHFKNGEWTNAIKTTLNEKVKPELVRIIQGQRKLEWTYSNEEAVKLVFDKAVRRFERLHSMSIYGDSFDERETFFRDCIINDPDIQNLKARFDLWCAIWFWHGDWMDENVPTPEKFYSPTPKILERTRKLFDELKFFHWELEFADVFVSGKGGFDAVVGNPPWETLQPSSMEFFTRYDPIYRMRGKQEALSKQQELFLSSKDIEHDWLTYLSQFKGYSKWMEYAGEPYGDPDYSKGFSFIRGKANQEFHNLWRTRRQSHVCFSDKSHPFQFQGTGKAYTYKMFLEIAHAISRIGGRFGYIVPSGAYTDQGSSEIRTLFLDHCKWEWVFGFENRQKIFQIDTRFKFCIIVIEKGGLTDKIQSAFMRHALGDWESPFKYAIHYLRDQVNRFSPKNKSILEIRTRKDLDVTQKVYSNSVFLGQTSSDAWNISYAQGDYNLTSDSSIIPPRDWWIEKGYLPNKYGYWESADNIKNRLVYRGQLIGSDNDLALPLYEGRMIGQFDFSEKGWVSGKGRSAVWRIIPWEQKQIEPQYLLSRSKYYESFNKRELKNAYMRISSATNTRSLISTCVWDYPCEVNASLLILHNYSHQKSFALSAILNSFVFDYNLRQRFGGTTLNWFIIEECSIPRFSLNDFFQYTAFISYCLNCIHELFASVSIKMKETVPSLRQKMWKSLWAITPYERLRLRCILDAIVAELYGLSYDDFAWILRDCGHPKENIRELSKNFDPKGFWRVDKEQDLELRHTVLALKAFADLKSMGLDAFCALNDGEGWMIPETLTYAVNPDGTIVFDTPEGKTVPVRERLGPRFLDWQLEGTPEESWKECEMHARNILGNEEFERMMADLKAGKEYQPQEEKIGVAEKVIGGTGATAVSGVSEVLKKASKKKEEDEKREKMQKTLGEW